MNLFTFHYLSNLLKQTDKVIVCALLITSSFSAHELRSELPDYVAYYPMDSDDFGYPLPMDPRGGGYLSTLIYDGQEAYSFGGNDVVRIPDHDDLNTYTGNKENYTISLWFEAREVTSTNGEQVIYEQGGITNGFNIYLYDGKLYAGAWSIANGWQGDWATIPSIETHTLYHVALTFDAIVGELKVYLNGELRDTQPAFPVAQHTAYIGVGGINFASKSHLRDIYISHYGCYMDGVIDDLSIYNHTLAASQVEEIYATYRPEDANNVETGKYARALGRQNIASSYGSLVIGQYNDDSYASSGLEWRLQDTLFEIGCGVLLDSNGTPDDFSDDIADRKNAMTVFKDARIEMGPMVGVEPEDAHALVITEDGDLLMGKRHGDISMGIFTD